MGLTLGGAPPVAGYAKGRDLYQRLGDEIRKLDAMTQVTLVTAFEKRLPFDRLPPSIQHALERSAQR
jgi:hypothetical protein